MKDAPSPPPAPDYAGAARAQGAANKETAQATALLGNPNINSPYGTQTVSYNTNGPEGNWIPTVNQTLNPQSQEIFNAQQQARMGLANLGQQGIGTAQSTLGQPFQFGGPGVQTSIPGVQQPQGAPNLGQWGQALQGTDRGNIQQGLNTSGIAAMPVNAGVTGQQAIMSRLQPQIERERAQLETQLRNQGLVAGGQAYDNEMRIQNQRENDLLSQATLQGIGLDLSANQQGFGQAVAGGQFANQAQQQGFGQNLAANQAYNQAIAQNQGAALQQQQAQNAAIGQGFNQQLQSGQFGNTAQQQALQQALYQRNLPLNEITALMSGSQIQNPQFPQYQGAGIQPAPIFNAAQQQAQYNQGLYGLGVGQYNAGLGALGQLGAAGLGMFRFGL